MELLKIERLFGNDKEVFPVVLRMSGRLPSVVAYPLTGGIPIQAMRSWISVICYREILLGKLSKTGCLFAQTLF